MKKTITRGISLVLAIVLVLALGLQAMAANVCQYISGDASETTSFIVSTKDRRWLNEKLTIKQSKGTAYWLIGAGSKKASSYCKYEVTYVNEATGASKTEIFKDSSITLTLGKNKTYKITVKPIGPTNMVCVGWVKPATWRVTNTKGVSTCG